MIIKSLSSSQIALIIKTGRAYNSGSFVLKTTTPNKNQGGMGFFGAFIASKKVFPGAVDRNRAKRRVKEAFVVAVNETIKQKNTIGLPHFIFLIKKSNETAVFAEIVQDIKQFLAKDYIINQ